VLKEPRVHLVRGLIRTKPMKNLVPTARRKPSRGLRLSPSETQLLAAQPFTDPKLHQSEWRTIEGFGRYEVSSEGYVRRGLRLLKPTKTRSGHLTVTVYDRHGKQ
jgi:hypothetical protein